MKTWSIKPALRGGHITVPVRRGEEDSRALLGTLTFDLSDVQELQEGMHDITERVVDETIRLSLAQLFGPALNPRPETMQELGDKIRPVMRELVDDLIVQRFGITPIKEG